MAEGAVEVGGMKTPLPGGEEWPNPNKGFGGWSRGTVWGGKTNIDLVNHSKREKKLKGGGRPERGRSHQAKRTKGASKSGTNGVKMVRLGLEGQPSDPVGEVSETLAGGKMGNSNCSRLGQSLGRWGGLNTDPIKFFFTVPL